MKLWLKFILRQISEKEYLLERSQLLQEAANKLREKRVQLANKLRGLN